MMASKSFVFLFDDVEVREREFTLIKAGKVLTVEPKAFRALLFLLHNPQRLISKEELLNTVWGDAAVTDGSLTRCIWLLRSLLGDDIHEPRYIATVATVGYRFVCKVEVSEDDSGNLAGTGKPNDFDGNDHLEAHTNRGIAEAAADPQALIGNGAAGEVRSGRQKGESRGRIRRWLLPSAAALVASPGSAVPPFPHIGGQTHRPWLAWSAVAVVLVAFAALSLIHFRERPLVPTPVQFQISPSGRMLQSDAFAVSPDGRHLAFVATGSDGIARLRIRNLDSLEVRVLSDSYPASWSFRGVVGPFFWSPDSRFIGFESGGKLAKIEISGGPAQALCDVQGTVLGGSWNRDGVIVFADSNIGLMQVSAAGGVASPLTTVDQSRNEIGHVLPSFLPDGRHFLYLRVSNSPEKSGAYVGSINTKPEEQDSKRLLATTAAPVYVPSSDSDSGQVLFVRQRTLMAQPFDAHRLEPTGEAVPIAEQVGSYLDYGFFSASSNGVLVYRSDAGQIYQLTWLDLQGKILATVAEPDHYNNMALSPDGRRVAVSRTNPENTGNWDVWLLDVGRNTSTRLTYEQVRATFPVWSADGSSVIFDAIRGGEVNLYLKLASGAGDERLLLKSSDGYKYATSSSRDGRFLLYTVDKSKDKK